MHFMVLALIAITGLLVLFGTAEHAGAQEVNPDSVRITLTAREGTTCRGLAKTFAGTEFECGSLITENPWLRASNGERIDIGDELLLPVHWNRRVLDNSARHVISVREIVEQPVGDVINNSGFGWHVLLIVSGVVAVLFFILGIVAVFAWVRAPGVMISIREAIGSRMRKAQPT